MAIGAIETRKAHPDNAAAILAAHLDSIRSLGPSFYPPEIVEAWGAGLTPNVYVKAMEGGEVFFIAISRSTASRPSLVLPVIALTIIKMAPLYTFEAWLRVVVSEQSC